MNRTTQSQNKKKSKFLREFDLKNHAFGAPLIPILLIICFFISELLFKSVSDVDIDGTHTWYLFLFSIPFALVITVLSTFFRNTKINIWVLCILTAIVPVYFSTQLVYSKFFGFLLTFTDVKAAGQITTFMGNTIAMIFKNLLNIIVFFIPLILIIIFRKSIFKPVKTTFAAKIVLIAIALLVQSVTVGIICTSKGNVKTGDRGDKYFYKDSFEKGIVADRFGILTYGRLDLKYTFVDIPTDEGGDVVNPDDIKTYDSDTPDNLENEKWYDTLEPENPDNSLIIKPNTMTKEEFEELVAGASQLEGMGDENICLYSKKADKKTTYIAAYKLSDDLYQKTKVVIPDGYNGDTASLGYQYSFNVVERKNLGYNVMKEIDFEKLILDEKNKDIKKLHNYFSTVEPSQKNEYTGMFKGKNVIYMTCESFSPAFISEELTPTLYKMINNGFVFSNYYVSDWAASTGGGEFCMATGLTALKTMNLGNQLMPASATKGTYLPFTLGNIMKQYGYTAKSFHNYKNDLYERAKSHKLWGYDYSYIGHGLDMKSEWPGSDKLMMEASIDKYINSTPFVVDYMTISGHGDYRAWNATAKRNKDKVQNLPYCEPIKVYVAANLELEYGMQVLFEKLEEAGILDDTVFVMAPDHWPYCLTPEYNVSNQELSKFYGFETDDTFERYHNGLVIYSTSMKEKVNIDKHCSSYDILPTVLNLLGVDYDSRLLAGTDILSPSEGIAITKYNKSWITDLGKYNASTGKFVPFDNNATVPEGYVTRINTRVKNMINYSQYIILYDYYKALYKEIGLYNK